MTPSQQILRFFNYKHLPPHLSVISEEMHDLALAMEERLPDGPEKTMGLRKLLEAKDCFVRAALPAEVEDDERSKFCPDCKGIGNLPAPSFSLGLCSRCEGSGCQHHNSQKEDTHCALCEQDNNCLRCQQLRSIPQAKPTEDEVFDPHALKED